MIRSLRWRLQLWHGLLLTTVLIIFGGVVYALQWQTRLQQADAELDRVASVLRSRLRGLFPVPRMPAPGTWPPRNPGRGPNPPVGPSGAGDVSSSVVADALTPANVPPRFFGVGDVSPPVASRDESREETNDPRRRDGRPPSRGAPRDATRDPQRDVPREGTRDGSRPGPGSREGSQASLPRQDGPPRDGPRETAEERSRDGARDQAGRNPWFSPPPGLGLPDEFQHLFDRDEENSFYFVIWDQHGTVLEKSKTVHDVPYPELHTAEDGLPVRSDRMREMHREVIHVSRFGRGPLEADFKVLVGRSLQPDLAELHQSGMRLVFGGLGVLAFGLAGGWWFSSRAIRPIAQMSAIAESISVKNLSTRINVQSTATELEQLATVLNRTFDRLQSAFERQGQFTTDASHELRTPLSVILSHAELALSRPRSSEEYQQAFQACRRASLRMKSLIDSLLLLARFDSGEPEIVQHSVELDQLAQDAVEMLQPLAEERRVKLQCRADAITIDADQERLFQVVTNLLNNAIRYNRPEGRVDLDVSVDDRFAIIRVTDTGVGIPAEDLPRIFDRFYRVDKARSRAEGGSGLGLAICQSIVEAHGGTISATSDIDVGTTIEVKIPLAPSTPSSHSAQEPMSAVANR